MNSIRALRTSLPAFESKEQKLQALGVTIAIVGSTNTVNEFRSLVAQYRTMDGDLSEASDTLATMPTDLTSQQVLSVGKDYTYENQVGQTIVGITAKFEDAMRADLDIK
jgi:hypothetical protein